VRDRRRDRFKGFSGVQEVQSLDQEVQWVQ
jgi:hypothetical protein